MSTDNTIGSIMGNRSSTLFLLGGGKATTAEKTNKRKRDDSSDCAELRLPKPKQPPVPMQKQQPGIALDTTCVPSFSVMPESLLLHIFSFVLKSQQ